MKVIGYVRVSTDSQASKGVSLEAQKSKIAAWADLNEYNETIIFEDAGVSGKRADNREGLQSALDNTGKGDALVVYSLSRLARSTKDTLSLADLLSRKGADLVSLSEKIDTSSAAGKMVFRMLAVLNEFERDQISERTKAALRYKRANGQKTGGDVPFGFDVTASGHLVENANEQKCICLIIKLRGKGYTLRAICSALESKGITTKKGKKKWHPKTVNALLQRAM